MGTALQGQTAIITGASSGIGRAIAEMFGQEGAHVFLIGRTLAPMEQSKARIEAAGGRADLAVFDICDTSRFQNYIGEVASQTGRLDIMVNNAGVQTLDPLLQADPQDWRNMLETNILAVLAGSQTAIRVMQSQENGGHIITISSTAAQEAQSGVYGATKHAVNVIMATLRKELQRSPIRLTTIMPGPTATNIARNYDPAVLKALLGDLPFEFKRGERLPDELFEQIQPGLSQILGSPEDVARTALFAVTQPARINIAELVVRPPVALSF